MFLPYLPPRMLDARTSGRSGPFASDDGVAALLSATGGVGVRTSHLDVEAVFDSPAHLLQFSRSHGQLAMWEAVPADKWELVARQLTETTSRLAEPGGRLVLRQQVRYTLAFREFAPDTQRL